MRFQATPEEESLSEISDEEVEENGIIVRKERKGRKGRNSKES